MDFLNQKTKHNVGIIKWAFISYLWYVLHKPLIYLYLIFKNLYFTELIFELDFAGYIGSKIKFEIDKKLS